MSEFNRPSLNTPEKLATMTTEELVALKRLATEHCNRQRDAFGSDAQKVAIHFSGLNEIKAELRKRQDDRPLKLYAVEFEGIVKYTGSIEARSEDHALECMRESFTMGIMYGDLTITKESVKPAQESNDA